MTTRPVVLEPEIAVRPRPRALSALSDRQLGQVTIVLGLIAALLAALAFYANLPASAVQLPQGVTTTAQQLMPQGWNFFTGNLRVEYPQAYELSSAGTWVYQGGALAVPSDLFGLDLSRRALGSEITLLVQFVPAHDWRSCTRTPTDCLAGTPVAARLVNTSTRDDLCGDVGFVRQQILPWAWRGTGTVQPSLVFRAEVSCKG